MVIESVQDNDKVIKKSKKSNAKIPVVCYYRLTNKIPYGIFFFVALKKSPLSPWAPGQQPG